MIAAGAYIATLIARQRLKVTAVAAVAGTSKSQVSRIMRGQDTNAVLFARIVAAVHGSLVQAQLLLLDEGASAEKGIDTAEEWLKMPVERRRRFDALAIAMPGLVDQVLEEMRPIIERDPSLWQGYARGKKDQLP